MSNPAGDSNDETNIPHKLLSTNYELIKFRGSVKLLEMVHQLMSNFQKLNCLGGFLPLIFNKMMELALGLTLKVANNLDSAKDKDIPKVTIR